MFRSSAKPKKDTFCTCPSSQLTGFPCEKTSEFIVECNTSSASLRISNKSS
ncbi:MAG: hypothetical protein HOE11_00550 [Candidatus Diapherotrites archaeon]|nr:hypothetical protein [Candidatus Diapherotrites archaeon]